MLPLRHLHVPSESRVTTLCAFSPPPTTLLLLHLLRYSHPSTALPRRLHHRKTPRLQPRRLLHRKAPRTSSACPLRSRGLTTNGCAPDGWRIAPSCSCVSIKAVALCAPTMQRQPSAFNTRRGPVAVTLRAIALDDLVARDKIVRYLQADALLKVAHTIVTLLSCHRGKPMRN